MAVKTFADVGIRQRSPFPVRAVFECYIPGDMAAGADLYQWIVPCDLRILDVLVHSATGGSGGTSTIVDVNRNGTTIFTTQANRPTLLAADSGAYTRQPPDVVNLKAGDILSIDCDANTTTEATETSIAIICGMPG